MTQHLNSLGKSALLILSNTIIVLPFMIFIQIAKGTSLLALLPFLLFYTFRMTGVFFIRGIKTRINSYSLLKISLYAGLLGSLLGFMGSFYFPFYTLSGILLGVSAAWLPMSNTSVNYYLKNTNQLIKGKTLVSLLLFLALGFSFVLSPSLKYPLFFVFYGIVYLLSFQLVGNLDNYKVDPNDLEKASYKYLILFALFFVCLFLLRSSRLLANSLEFDYFIFGFFFLVILYIVATNFFKNKIQRNIPRKLSYLTAINGAVGNYLFLFCSLYVAGFYGHQHLFLQFYLPYVLGIVFASKVKNLLGNNVKTYSLIGIFLGLLLIVFSPLFALGLFLTSLFKGSLNSSLTQDYESTINIVEDKRIWVKYTIQNIGSILHQFLLMLLGSLIIMKNGLSIKTLFVITSTPIPTARSIELMKSWNLIATSLIILIIIAYLIYPKIVPLLKKSK